MDFLNILVVYLFAAISTSVFLMADFYGLSCSKCCYERLGLVVV